MLKRSLKDEEATFCKGKTWQHAPYGQQKIAEKMLDAGSIAYIQKEEKYYNSAEFMLQGSFPITQHKGTGTMELRVWMGESRIADENIFVE